LLYLVCLLLLHYFRFGVLFLGHLRTMALEYKPNHWNLLGIESKTLPILALRTVIDAIKTAYIGFT